MPVATGAAAPASASSSRRRLSGDLPWRPVPTGNKPVPRVHQNPALQQVPQNPRSAYALQVMKHPDPIREGLATEARLEAAGPNCIVPGQIAPVKLLGLKEWPANLKFMEPVGRQITSIGKFMGSTFNARNSSTTEETREVGREAV